MSSADLGQPILLFILFFWGFIVIAAVLTYLLKQGKISGLNFLERWKTHHHPPRRS